MSFGPGTLSPTHRYILKQHKSNISRYLIGAIEWDSKDLAVVKRQIRISLREQQEGRCVYCRRMILIERRNATEDLEHYLDKSKPKYRKWAFSPVNIALACHPCNLQKSTRDMGDARVSSSGSLTASAGEYRWIHPYFDDYFENIEILREWLYVVKAGAPSPSRARNMINDCELDKISTIEMRKSLLLRKINRLQIMALRCFYKNPERSRKLIVVSQQLVTSAWQNV